MIGSVSKKDVGLLGIVADVSWTSVTLHESISPTILEPHLSRKWTVVCLVDFFSWSSSPWELLIRLI
jgi:hypothetical protein